MTPMISETHGVRPAAPASAAASDSRTGRGWIAVAAAALLLAAGGCGPAAPDGEPYDLVVLDGRVVDPASGLDSVRNVGVRGDSVAAVTRSAIRGRDTIDASGLVVAPGFIDVHDHGHTAENYRAKAADGVTATLELEVGVGDVASWYAEREGETLVHYGASVGHIPVRMDVMDDEGDFLPRGPAARREATPEEIAEIRRRIEEGLRQGAPAVGFGLQYTPGATREEVLEVFRAAAGAGAPAAVHLRFMGDAHPRSALAGLQEVVAASAVTGVPLHVVHVHSSGLTATPRLLRVVDEAREAGLPVTAEAYPYTAAMTDISSALFDPGWREILGIGYGELEWVESGERLTEESFRRYREEGGMVVIHMIPDSVVRAALSHPAVMVASDGRLEDGRGHPRSAGTHARVLGRYVREEGLLGLSEAVRKMTLAPARLLEGRVPSMRRKGRVQPGADADLTIFDPETVADRATYREPARHSRGIRWVLVAGVPVVAEGELRDDVSPGRPIRAEETGGAP